MLKIKNNVDLKELEKYGFKYNKTLNSYTKILMSVFFYRTIEVYIDNPNYKPREIKAFSSVLYEIINEKWLEDNIQDLIKADLVEKVDDNND